MTLLIQDVLATLPHRPPFLLVDRVLSVGPEEAHALKNVTMNEPFFAGHFPGEPVMPGVLILEALAQTSMFTVLDHVAPGAVGYLAGMEAVRFRRKVVPGDTLHLFARREYFRRGVGKTVCRAEVDGEVVAEATILFGMAPGSAARTGAASEEQAAQKGVEAGQ